MVQLPVPHKGVVNLSYVGWVIKEFSAVGIRPVLLAFLIRKRISLANIFNCVNHW